MKVTRLTLATALMSTLFFATLSWAQPLPELSTDRPAYVRGIDQVTFVLINRTDRVVILPNDAPWSITNVDTGRMVAVGNVRDDQLGKRRVPPMQTAVWSWNQKMLDGKTTASSGSYKIELQTENNRTLPAYFSIEEHAAISRRIAEQVAAYGIGVASSISATAVVLVLSGQAAPLLGVGISEAALLALAWAAGTYASTPEQAYTQSVRVEELNLRLPATRNSFEQSAVAFAEAVANVVETWVPLSIAIKRYEIARLLTGDEARRMRDEHAVAISGLSGQLSERITSCVVVLDRLVMEMRLAEIPLTASPSTLARFQESVARDGLLRITERDFNEAELLQQFSLTQSDLVHVLESLTSVPRTETTYTDAQYEALRSALEEFLEILKGLPPSLIATTSGS